MKLQHLLLIVAFWLVAPASLLAQRSHKPGTASHGHQAAGETHAHTSPHGGIVRTAGNYHVELVLAQGQLTAYLLDANERTVATAGMTGTALVQQGSKTTSVSLTAAANNALRGALPTGATPTTAIITLHRRNETITARFDKLASTSSKAKAMNYICPMQCEGSESTALGSCPKCGMALVKKS